MGVQVHYLYALDLSKPSDIRDSLLVATRSFNDGCTEGRQLIPSVNWMERTKHLRVSIATPDWSYESSQACEGLERAKRPPVSSALEFALSDSGFHPVPLREH